MRGFVTPILRYTIVLLRIKWNFCFSPGITNPRELATIHGSTVFRHAQIPWQKECKALSPRHCEEFSQSAAVAFFHHVEEMYAPHRSDTAGELLRKVVAVGA